MSENELGERVLRSEHRLPATAGLELATAATRKRKPLTPELLEERRKKVSTCVGARIKISSIIKVAVVIWDCMDDLIMITW